MVKEDRLSDLPDSILIHILSMICENTKDSKKVVRSSVLSKRWQFLWKSVLVSLDYYLDEHFLDDNMQDLVNSTHRELHYFRSFKKIRKFKLFINFYRQEEFVKDVNLWIYLATKLVNVEDFELECESGYEFPQFAYKNTSLRNLDLRFCTISPLANVNWSGIVSLSFSETHLTNGVMKKILFGCPNLECLKFYSCYGFHHLGISNVKSRKLVIERLCYDRECDEWLEITAPYIQDLKIMGSCEGIRLRNVDLLVTTVLNFKFDFSSDSEDEEEDPLQRKRKESTCLKELFTALPMSRSLN